ncbi:MAG: trpA [Gammaproteobacteria bacterium]|jgi:tryptophan synthase alpha chain|nr:trpA [Gammaproteobacteria bacterium]
MPNRISASFKDHKVFAGYITVGDGDSVAIAKALIQGGVNMLELGVPFSDPVADGPVIQRAAQRALENHTTLFDVLEVAKKIRADSSIPLVLFGYFNPFLHADPAAWLPQAKSSGIDGILVVDLPYEEGKNFYRTCLAHDILPIPVITPVTSTSRLKIITRYAKGFLYYANHKGTTGVRSGLPADFSEKIAAIQSATHLPILAGFGISGHKDAQEILKHADGFVVGSFFMKALEDGASLKELTQIARGFLEERI